GFELWLGSESKDLAAEEELVQRPNNLVQPMKGAGPVVLKVDPPGHKKGFRKKSLQKY
ncbi:hypothetical protein FRC00_013098, partial [Tulasnella sp. 408]